MPKYVDRNSCCPFLCHLLLLLLFIPVDHLFDLSNIFLLLFSCLFIVFLSFALLLNHWDSCYFRVITSFNLPRTIWYSMDVCQTILKNIEAIGSEPSVKITLMNTISNSGHKLHTENFFYIWRSFAHIFDD